MGIGNTVYIQNQKIYGKREYRFEYRIAYVYIRQKCCGKYGESKPPLKKQVVDDGQIFFFFQKTCKRLYLS